MSKFIDLTGKRFGRLVVLEWKKINGNIYWACKCDCGGENGNRGGKAVQGENLRNGHTQSCGCLQREMAKQTQIGKNLSEETKRKISKWHKNKVLSEETKGKISKWHKNKIFSEETKRKISESHKGCKSHFWKGGIFKWNSRFRIIMRNIPEYRQWIKSVFTRDNYTCQDCGQRGGRLEAHHIKEFQIIIDQYKITTVEDALRCWELWEVGNGETLCKRCHKKYRKLIK